MCLTSHAAEPRDRRYIGAVSSGEQVWHEGRDDFHEISTNRIETMDAAGHEDEYEGNRSTELGNSDSDHTGESHRATEQEEAQVVEAWQTGNYPTRERCLKAIGLERLNNAAFWKRVKRAIDRTGRRTRK